MPYRVDYDGSPGAPQRLSPESEIIVKYLEAYSNRHGCWPKMGFLDNHPEYVTIQHPPSVSDDDTPVWGHIHKDLPVWAAHLQEQASERRSIRGLLNRLAPVNIREVFAYELSAFEGS